MGSSVCVEGKKAKAKAKKKQKHRKEKEKCSQKFEEGWRRREMEDRKAKASKQGMHGK